MRETKAELNVAEEKYIAAAGAVEAAMDGNDQELQKQWGRELQEAPADLEKQLAQFETLRKALP